MHKSKLYTEHHVYPSLEINQTIKIENNFNYLISCQIIFTPLIYVELHSNPKGIIKI